MISSKFILVLALACAVNLRADSVTIQYVDDFEAYAPGTVLDDINHWHGSTDDVQVQTDVYAADSTRSAIIPARTELSNSFHAAYSTNLWVGMDVIVEHYDDLHDNPPLWADGNAQFYVSTSGYFVAYNAGYGWETLSNDIHGAPVAPVPSNEWVRVDVRMDYEQRQWRLAVNSRMLATNLHFMATGPELFNGFEVYTGANSTSYLDNVFVYDTDAMPRLTTVPAAFTNTIIAGYAVPSQMVEVISAGDGSFDYQIEKLYGSLWLELSFDSGSLTDNMTNQLWVSYATNHLAPGANTDILRFVSTDWGGMTQTVAVTVNLDPLHVDPGPDQVVFQGLDAWSTLTVENAGAGDYDYTLIPTVPWLHILPDYGTVGTETNAHTLQFVTTSLAPGTHTAGIRLESPSHGGVTQSVEVAVYVMKLERAPPILSWTIPRGATITDAKTFEVWNAGSGVIDFTAKSETDWVHIAPTNGTSTGPGMRPNVAVDITGSAGFAAGTHTGRVKLTAQDGQGYVSTQTVAVLVKVTEPAAPLWMHAAKGESPDRVRVYWRAAPEAATYELWRKECQQTTATGAGINRPQNYGGAHPDSVEPAGLQAGLVSSLEGRYAPRTEIAGHGDPLTIETSTDWIRLAVIPAPTTAYEDTTAVPGRRYCYRVRSVNQHGYTGAYTLSDDGWRRLSPPPALTATLNDHDDRIRLAWPAAAGDTAGYEIWRNVSGGRARRVGTTAALSYNDTGAEPGVLYYYWLRATNALGHSTDGVLAEGVRRVGAPELRASDGTHADRVALAWPAVDGAQGYEVWVRGSQQASPSSLVTGPWSQARVRGPWSLVPGRAESALVHSCVGGKNQDPETTDQGPRTGRVSWDFENAGMGMGGGRGGADPCCAAAGTCSPAPLRRHMTGRVSWDFENAGMGMGGGRGGSDPCCAAAGTCSPAPLRRHMTGRVSWDFENAGMGMGGGRGGADPSGSGAHFGSVEPACPQAGLVAARSAPPTRYSDVASSSWTLLATLPGSATGYDHATAEFGRGYTYRVRALNPISTGDYAMATGWLAPAQTPQLRASDGNYTYKVKLSWDTLPGAARYEVQRGTNASFTDITVLGTITGTAFDDTTAVPGRAYYYRVRAISADLSWLSHTGRGVRRLVPPAQVVAGAGDAPLGIQVEWTAVTGAGEYEVWSHTGNDVFDATLRARISGTAWVDTSAALGAERYYWVRARTAASISAYSFSAHGRAAMSLRLGGPDYTPLAGDFDGDGLDDPAVYHAPTGVWRVRLSTLDYAEISVSGWGGPEWAPVPADYDGDGRVDPAVYNPIAGAWRVWLSGAGYEPVATTGWGGPAWLPVPADYDGDGLTDPAVYNPIAGTWRVWLSNAGYRPVTYSFGGPDYTGLALDFYGTGAAVPVIYAPANGCWNVRE